MDYFWYSGPFSLFHSSMLFGWGEGFNKLYYVGFWEMKWMDGGCVWLKCEWKAKEIRLQHWVQTQESELGCPWVTCWLNVRRHSSSAGTWLRHQPDEETGPADCLICQPKIPTVEYLIAFTMPSQRGWHPAKHRHNSVAHSNLATKRLKTSCDVCVGSIWYSVSSNSSENLHYLWDRYHYLLSKRRTLRPSHFSNL